MNNQYQLFTEVQPFYSTLLGSIEKAQKAISMLYLIFDQGVWANQISEVLVKKHAAGVRVRLMTDYLGTLTDHPLNIIHNFQMLSKFKLLGMSVFLFNPAGPRMSFLDRLHIKLCAVDDCVMLVGGSNIGDYYTSWQDTNFLIRGDLNGVGHTIFDYIASQSTISSQLHSLQTEPIDLTAVKCGDADLFLTVPGARRDIYRNIIDLVLAASGTIYWRYWYFLPNAELLNAMLSQLERGIKINVLLSHHTRVPPIDLINRLALRKLCQAGASIYRYKNRYMHSKLVWTDSGEVIIGSANIENRAMRNNFELCIRLKNPQLADQLSEHFWRDTEKCHCL